MFQRILFAVLIVFGFIFEGFAQDGASLGLGGANTAIARGTEAIFWNPANLALSEPTDTKLNIKLFSWSGGAGNNSFDMNLYNEIFGVEKDAQGRGKFLTQDDKNDILARVDDDDGLALTAKGDFSVFAITYKNFGFSLEGNINARGSIAKDAVLFPLEGFVRDSYDFSVNGNGVGVVETGKAPDTTRTV